MVVFTQHAEPAVLSFEALRSVYSTPIFVSSKHEDYTLFPSEQDNLPGKVVCLRVELFHVSMMVQW